MAVPGRAEIFAPPCPGPHRALGPTASWLLDSGSWLLLIVNLSRHQATPVSLDPRISLGRLEGISVSGVSRLSVVPVTRFSRSSGRSFFFLRRLRSGRHS